MTSLQALEMARLLDGLLAGTFAGRVCQPGDWFLGIEVPDGRTLGFCWQPGRLVLGLCDWAWPRGVPVDVLKAHLQSARIAAVSAMPGEPIVRLHLRGERARALVFEALGRSANLLLTGEDDRILWSGRKLGGPFRTGEPGTQWLPPPPRVAPAGGQNAPFDPERFLLEEAPGLLREGLIERGRAAVLSKLVAREKALQRRLKAVQGDLHEGEQWIRMEALGQALIASGDLRRRGESSRKVLLYVEGAAREEAVPLDPALSVLENAQALFRRSKKGLARQKAVTPILAEIMESLGELPEQKRRLETCEDLDLLYPAGRRVVAAPPRQARRTLPQGVAAVPLPDGYAGYAGKSAEGNDWVSFRIGRGVDFWFHAEDYPGCHVVVKNPDRRESLPGSVEKAAALYAAAHSGAPPGNRVAVRVSRCKNLRRVPGSPGRAMVAGSRTVFVDLPSSG